MREKIREHLRELQLRRKPVPAAPITTQTLPCRRTTVSDFHQDEELAARSRAVASWLAMMDSDARQTRAAPPFANYTAAFGMDYDQQQLLQQPQPQPQPKPQPKPKRLPLRSRWSLTAAMPSRTRQQQHREHRPEHRPSFQPPLSVDVSPVTTASHLFQPLTSLPSNPTQPTSTSEDVDFLVVKSTTTSRVDNGIEPTPMTNALLDSIDSAFPNFYGRKSAHAVAVAVAVSPTRQPRVIISPDVSAVQEQFRDQPIVKPASEKRSDKPKLVAIRSQRRSKPRREGANTRSEEKDGVHEPKGVEKKPSPPPAYDRKAAPAPASHSRTRQRPPLDSKASAFPLHELHHENIVPHPITITTTAKTASLLSNFSLAPTLDARHRTLKHCLARHPTGFDEPLVSSLTRQMLLALAYLHRRGLTHRNLRTSTVFIGPNGSCRLGGLHHATYHKNAVAAACSASRKARYNPRVAPETLALQESTATSKLDIWDLGILVLEMLGPSGRWRKHDVIRALLLEPMEGGVLLLEKVDGGRMSVGARLFLMDCLQVSPFRRSTAEALLSEHQFCRLDSGYDFNKTALGRSLRGR